MQVDNEHHDPTALAGNNGKEESSEASGYASDVSVLPNQVTSTGSSDPATELSDSADSFFPYGASDDEDDEEDDLEQRIDYIAQKQRLLKRAYAVLFQDDAYDASIARTSLENAQYIPSETEGSIWNEAAEILKSLDQRKGDAEAPVVVPPPAKRGRFSGRRNEGQLLAPNPKDPTIDVSQVNVISPAQYSSDEEQRQQKEQALLDSSIIGHKQVFANTHWMAKALIYGSPAHKEIHKLRECSWKVVSDPRTSFLGLIPPSTMSMKNAVKIEEALALTQEARIVTQATPPFSIVHANKAFLQMFTLKSTESILCQPVESIVRVTQDMDAPTTLFLDSKFLANDRTCRMHVVPVLDPTHRRRNHSCVSHVMMRFLVGTHQEAQLPSEHGNNTAISTGGHSKLLGTVG